MKNIIPIIILSLVLLSCAKEDDSSTTTTTELEGTWVKSCYTLQTSGDTYYMIESVTVSGTNWAHTYEYHSDSSCATDVGKFTFSYVSLTIGDVITWNDDGVKYKDVFLQSEKEYSAYNFEFANTEDLLKNFEIAEAECKALLEKNISLPAYDQCLKASHIFNLLDARGVIGEAQRTEYISRIRELAKGSGKVWLESQK